VARKFGAQGIGLCRTEHMFFEGDHRLHARNDSAEDEAGRRKALKKLLKFQTDDFYGILKAMEGYRLPSELLIRRFTNSSARRKSQKEMAKQLGISAAAVKAKVDSLHEFNPMLGHRGCRLVSPIPKSPKCRQKQSLKQHAS
jgi:pyruvate,orthophosphate dikinase